MHGAAVRRAGSGRVSRLSRSMEAGFAFIISCQSNHHSTAAVGRRSRGRYRVRNADAERVAETRKRERTALRRQFAKTGTAAASARIPAEMPARQSMPSLRSNTAVQGCIRS